MTNTILAFLSPFLCFGIFIFVIVFVFLVCAPIFAAAAVHDEQLLKEQINNQLKIARTRKIQADQEILESRRAKLDSEVAILELRIEEKRRNLGKDTDFKVNNY